MVINKLIFNATIWKALNLFTLTVVIVKLQNVAHVA